MDIVVDWAVVSLVTVVLAWVVNEGVPLLGRLFKQAWALSDQVKKGVAFLSDIGLVYTWKPPVALPDPSTDTFLFIESLLAQATLVFKVAQPVYDYIWKGLIVKNIKKLLA